MQWRKLARLRTSPGGQSRARRMLCCGRRKVRVAIDSAHRNGRPSRPRATPFDDPARRGSGSEPLVVLVTSIAGMYMAFHESPAVAPPYIRISIRKRLSMHTIPRNSLSVIAIGENLPLSTTSFMSVIMLYDEICTCRNTYDDKRKKSFLVALLVFMRDFFFIEFA